MYLSRSSAEPVSDPMQTNTEDNRKNDALEWAQQSCIYAVFDEEYTSQPDTYPAQPDHPIVLQTIEPGVLFSFMRDLEPLPGKIGHIIAAVIFGLAESELEDIRERQAAGIAIAKKRGVSIDQLADQVEVCREKLFTTRKLRIPPLTDDKVLTAWNGMMISALAAGGRILEDHGYIAAAETAADFILTTLRDSRGNLLRRYRDGDAAIAAFAEDYAFLGKGLLDLYRATFNPQRLQQAIDLAEQLVSQFMDPESGLIYETSETNRELIVRPKNLFDAAHPSTNSIALQLFARLHLLTGEALWRERSETLLAGLAPSLHAYPAGFTCGLQGAALLLEPTREIVLAGEEQSTELDAMIQVINRTFAPETTALLRPDTENGTIKQLAPFTQQMDKHQQPAAAYICQNFTCRKPVTEAKELGTLLQEVP